MGAEKVAVVTNNHLECGNAEYGRDLVKHLGLLGVDVCACGPWDAPQADVVIVNWHPDRVPLSPARMRSLRESGSKVVVIFQNSNRLMSGLHITAAPMVFEILSEADAVVAHEMIEDYPFVNLRVIPHGIKEFDPPENILVAPCIGTAGFAFPWKMTDVVVRAAKSMNASASIFAPRHDYYDVSKLIEKWEETLGDHLSCHTSFLPDQQVIGALSVNWLNIFWFQSMDVSDEWGQSGSARLGVAARRPMIVSRHRKLRTLIEGHEDEFCIADTEDQVIEMAQQICMAIRMGNPVAVPSVVYEEQKWSVAAEKYHDLIKGLLR